MSRLGNILTTLATWAKAPVSIETYTKEVTISANGYGSIDQTITKSGYMPVALTGFNVNGTGSSAAQAVKAIVSSSGDGTGTMVFGIKNDSTSSVTWTLTAKILWLKSIGGGVS